MGLGEEEEVERIKEYLTPLVAGAILAGCSPDIPDYDSRHLFKIKPGCRYVELLFDTNRDGYEDLRELRCLEPDGAVSRPIAILWDKNNSNCYTDDEIIYYKEKGYECPDIEPAQVKEKDPYRPDLDTPEA